MAPFTKSMSVVRLQSFSGVSRDEIQPPTSKEDDTFTLEAWVDEEWMVATVPNGGYLLGLILQACSLVQGGTNQREPLYLSSQYLGSSSAGPCIITIKRIKDGKSYCNLIATLSQSGRTNIHCQLIYGTLNVARHPFGAFPATPGFLTYEHPHAMSRRCPLATHPSKCTISPFRRPYTYARHIVQGIDPYYTILLQRKAKGHSPTNSVDLGGGGTTRGGWYQLLDKEDVITPQMIPLLADTIPELLPDSLAVSPQRGAMWFPTLALSADFKYRVPSSTDPAPGIAVRTVGVFVTMKFLIEGRYEVTSEVWTAPCEIGRGREEEGWQDKMYCMASMTQTAMTVPASVNFKKVKRENVNVSKL